MNYYVAPDPDLLNEVLDGEPVHYVITTKATGQTLGYVSKGLDGQWFTDAIGHKEDGPNAKSLDAGAAWVAQHAALSEEQDSTNPTPHTRPGDKPVTLNLDQLAEPGAIYIEVVDEQTVAVHIGPTCEVFSLDHHPDQRVVVDVARRIAAAYAQAYSLLLPSNAHLRVPKATEGTRAKTRPTQSD